MDPDTAQPPSDNTTSPQSNIGSSTDQQDQASSSTETTKATNFGLPYTESADQTTTDQPISSTTSSQSKDVSETGDNLKSKAKLKLLIILILVAVLFVILSVTWAVAYEKVKLEKYPDIQKRVSHIIQSLPLLPKTPKFLIEKSIQAQKQVGKLSYNISAAYDSPGLMNTLGVGYTKLDIEAKGAVDYSNPSSPIVDLNASLTKDFNFEVKLKDKILYFRINKVPTFLLSLAGVSPEQLQPILNVWVSYDTSTLETAARKQIDAEMEAEQVTTEILEDFYEKYIDEEVLSKMKVTSTELDGHKVYKVRLDADAELIDHIGKMIEEEVASRYDAGSQGSYSVQEYKLSDSVKKLVLEVFVDKRQYYIRGFNILADFEADEVTSGYPDSAGAFSMGLLPTGEQKASFSFSAKFSDFDKDVSLDLPTDFITFDEFSALMSQITGEFYGSTESAKDAVRMSDLAQLQIALELFYAECGTYPSKLSSSSSLSCTSIAPSYVVEIPKDPDGSDYYYKSKGTTYDLCAKLHNEQTAEGTCPDSNYNYHLANPET